MFNRDIRNAAKEAHVFLWQIADRIGINDGNFSRKLRKELSPDEKERVMTLIDELAQEHREVV